MRYKDYGPIIQSELPLPLDVFTNDSRAKIGIITGCNGSGKTTTIRALSEENRGLIPIMRHTTKDLRNTDFSYKKVSNESFEAMIDANALVEAALYGPGYYGTSIDNTRFSAQINGMAVVEMDIAAATVFKSRFRNISNYCIRSYLLNPFPQTAISPTDRYKIIMEKTERSNLSDREEIDRLKKAAITDYTQHDYDRVISTWDLNVDDVTELINKDMTNGK